MTDSLDPFEVAVAVALATACHYSLHRHIPVNAVQSKFPKNLRGDVAKSLEVLRRRGLCQKHPTRGGVTWEISRDGLQFAESTLGNPIPGAPVAGGATGDPKLSSGPHGSDNRTSEIPESSR